MAKLEPHNHLSIEHESIALIVREYGIEEFEFKPIDAGIANTTLLIESNGKKYVLRVYARNGKSSEDILFELKFQDYLRVHDIPIPRIYPNTAGYELTTIEVDGKQWQVILMDFVEGESKTQNPSHELIANTARLQAKMHLLGIEFAKNVDKPKVNWIDLHDSLVQKIDHKDIQDKTVLDFFERVRPFSYPLSQELPYGYNHLDVDFDGNVITKDDEVRAIVDFDDVEYSPVIVCLGYSLWNILDETGEDAMRLYLKEYETVRPLTQIERDALPHVLMFRNYVIAVIRLLLQDTKNPAVTIQPFLEMEKIIPSLTF